MKKRDGIYLNKRASYNPLTLVFIISLGFIFLFLISSFKFDKNETISDIRFSPSSYTFSFKNATYHYVAMPLDAENYSLNYLFPDAPIGSTIYLWEYNLWNPHQRSGRPMNQTPTWRLDSQIKPGQAFIMKSNGDYNPTIFGNLSNEITINIQGSLTAFSIPYSNNYYTASRVLEEIQDLDSSCQLIRNPNDYLGKSANYSYEWWSLYPYIIDNGTKNNFAINNDQGYFISCSNTTNFTWKPKKINQFYEFSFKNATYHYTAMPLNTGNHSLDYIFSDAPQGSLIYLWRYNHWHPYQRSGRPMNQTPTWRPLNMEIIPGEPFIMESNGDYDTIIFGDPINNISINIQGSLTPFSIPYSNNYYTASRVLEEIQDLDSSCQLIRNPNDYSPFVFSTYTIQDYAYRVSCNSQDIETNRYQSSFNYTISEPIYTITCQNMSTFRYTYDWWALDSSINDNGTKTDFQIIDNQGYFISCSNTTNFTWTPSRAISSVYCGDGICNNGESCSSCNSDCGSCYNPSGGSSNNDDDDDDTGSNLNNLTDYYDSSQQQNNVNNQQNSENNNPPQDLDDKNENGLSWLVMFWLIFAIAIIIALIIYFILAASKHKNQSVKNEEVAPPFLIKDEPMPVNKKDEKIKKEIQELLIQGHNFVNQKIIVRADDVYNQIKKLYSQLSIKDKETYSKIMDFYKRFN